MPQVDPDDDDIDRWVVWHYRYDSDRRERRNVTLAAFDNETECSDRMTVEAAQLRERKSAGTAEAVERIGGAVLTAGHRARSEDARIRPRPKKARERRRHRS